MNYLQKKELDTLKKQGYDIASVQKGIALALGAKPEEKVSALLTNLNKEKEICMQNHTDENICSQQLTYGDIQKIQSILREKINELQSYVDNDVYDIAIEKALDYPEKEILQKLRSMLRLDKQKLSKMVKLQTKIKRIKFRS